MEANLDNTDKQTQTTILCNQSNLPINHSMNLLANQPDQISRFDGIKQQADIAYCISFLPEHAPHFKAHSGALRDTHHYYLAEHTSDCHLVGLSTTCERFDRCDPVDI